MFELFTEIGEYETIEIHFSVEDASKRVDIALSEHSELSRNRIQQLIEQGNVSLNGELINSKKIIVQAGDSAIISVRLRISLELEPEDMPLDIVFEDENLIVVYKPKGMVVHPAHGNETGTLVNGLLAHILKSGGSLSAINGEVRPGIVHRIDKDTSGLLVIAKTDFAHQNLSAQLSDHSMKRIYHTIVSGGFRDEDGTIDIPIGRDPKDRKKQKVRPDGGGRDAVTHYHVVERFSGATLLEIRLETGRTHQIRVHMAYSGHPVLGDELYGKGKGGQYLHAGTLGFLHPVTQEYMEFTRELPPVFLSAIEKLRRQKQK